ncbi:MAG: hypothetical protein Fur0023_19690 [Bacteroidia bacterium]
MEDFGTGCNQGQLANGTVATPTNGAWTVSSTGINNAYANEWYISSTSSEISINNCDQGCLTNTTLTNQSLHISNVYIFTLTLQPDQGAVYFEGSCNYGICTNTNKRVESPTINCTGYNNVSLSFDYIQEGTPGSDYATLMYFDGTNWISLGNIPSTNNSSCSQMGYWTNYTTVLPASANNNPNVKIGFNWQNIDDGVATDPSFAVDNIILTVLTSNIKVTNENELSFKMFPNPVTGGLLKIIPDSNNKIKNITIKDITGRTLSTLNMKDDNEINIDYLNNGLYFLEVDTDNGIERTPFIKQ